MMWLKMFLHFWNIRHNRLAARTTLSCFKSSTSRNSWILCTVVHVYMHCDFMHCCIGLYSLWSTNE
jgi:hypothetical protein